jgi:hypothetical protein
MSAAASLMRRVICSLLLAAAGPTLGADVYVIAHTPMSLNPEQIKEIFLGEVQFVGPIKALPIDNSVSQPEFLSKVLKLQAVRYSALWTKKAFRDGLNAPPLKGTDAEVIAFVRSQPGAIGYVSTLSSGVALLAKF